MMQRPFCSQAVAEKILDFWFAPEHRPKWFLKEADFDAQVTDHFLTHYKEACQGRDNETALHWKQWLGTIILLDQFPRNMFRHDKRAYAMDPVARKLTKKAIDQKIDKPLTVQQRQFLYMPLMHSEEFADQVQSVKLFEALGDKMAYEYAQQHFDIIKRFGRFPHRNRVLSRLTTMDEALYLAQPNAGF